MFKIKLVERKNPLALSAQEKLFATQIGQGIMEIETDTIAKLNYETIK